MQYLCNICANLMRVILTLPLPVWWRLQLQWTPPPCTICVRFVQHMCRYSSNVRILNKGENIWKKYTWKYLCYTCANICARKMMARVAVRPLPVQIRRESSYLPHTDPQCPPSRWLRWGHLCHSFTCNLSRGKGKPHSGAKLFWDLLCHINFLLPFLGRPIC